MTAITNLTKTGHTMKKILIALLCAPILIVAQTNTQNWSKKTTYREANSGRPLSTVTYYDGLGRPIQQNVNKQSGNGKDLITHIEYDLGRQLKEYLPYPATTNDMSFQMGAQSATLNYPQYSGQYPFSEKVLEASPLARPLKQGAPGTDWQVNPTGDTDHTIKTVYETNNANEVKNYFALTIWDDANGVYNIQLQDKGFYSPNQLYKTITKNENWKSGNDNTSEEFKDKEGRVVLKRTYNNGAHDTYYVYDIFGNQTYVIPPLVTDPVNQLDDLCFQYKYDHRNRMVEKKLPGKQWESIIYDKLDRVVATGLTLSPFGGTEKGYLISKYDGLDRVVYTAWLPSTAPRSSLQQQYNTETINFSEKRLRPGSTIDVDNVAVAYSNIVVPTSGIKLLSVTYYDDYDYPGAVAIPNSIEGQEVAVSVVGQATGNWVRVLTSISEILNEQSYLLYDKNYRVIRSNVSNHLGGYIRVDSKLDFSGKELYSKVYHKLNANATELSITDSYSYSDEDRLLLHTHKINSDPEQLISKYTYNDIGQLISKNVGGSDTTGATGLQKLDFRYNIRGWLTDINNSAPQGNAGFTLATNALFGFKVNYNTVTQSENNNINFSSTSLNGEVKPLYNGNISESFWLSKNDNQLRKYGYKYDNLNRLLKAFYQKPLSHSPNTGSYNEEAQYDKNGNITNLKRNGNLDNPVFNIEVDDLNFVYNGNRLIRVDDLTNNPEGFKDNAYGNSADDYVYDEFGNVTRDLNKGIVTISYNHLNLPTEVVYSSGEKINYIYNGFGVKLQKRITTSNTTIFTDYQNGFQYENQILKVFPHSEGYVHVTGNTFFNYVFNYVDHLGNVRSSFAWDDKDGALKIINENHYYPFGLSHKAYNNQSYVFVPSENGPGYYRAELVQEGSRTPVNPYKFKFNGQELQDELGLNTIAMDYRQYDPTIGRFGSVDLLSELFSDGSPYSFAFNSPIYFNDPSGLCPECPSGATNGQEYKSTGGATYVYSGGEWTRQDGQLSEISITAKVRNKTAGNETNTSIKAEQPKSLLFGLIKNPNINEKGQSPLEVYRENRGNPGYRPGEDKWDRIFRLINNSHAEQMLDFGGGGHNMWGGYGRAVQGAKAVQTAGANAVQAGEGTYSVYQGFDAANNIRYVGITSRNPLVRFVEHLNSMGQRSTLRYEVIEGASKLTKEQAKILEQTLINQYGLQKNGGQLINKINSIAPQKWGAYGL